MNEWTFISQKLDMSMNALSKTPASLHRGVTLHTDKLIWRNTLSVTYNKIL